MTGRGLLRIGLPALLAVITVAAALYPMARQRYLDSVAAEQCIERLDQPGPAREGEPPDLASGPHHDGVVAVSDDGRRSCMDLTIAFVAPRAMDEVHLLVPTVPGAVRIDAVDVSGHDVEAVPEAALASVVRVPIVGTIEVGSEVQVRFAVTIRAPRGTSREESLRGLLPTVDLAEPDPPRERRERAAAGTWDVVVRADDHIVTGGVDEPCEPAATARCVVTRAEGISDLAVLTLAEGERGHDDVRIPGADVRAHGDVPVDEALDALGRFTEALGPLPWPELDLVPLPAAERPEPGIARLGGDCPGERLAPLPEAACIEWGAGRVLAAQWFGAYVRTVEERHRAATRSTTEYLAAVNARLSSMSEEDARGHIDALVEPGRRGIVGMTPALPPNDPLPPHVETALVRGWAVHGWLGAESAAGREAVLAILREVLVRRSGRELRPEHVLDVAEERSAEARAALSQRWQQRVPRTSRADG